MNESHVAAMIAAILVRNEDGSLPEERAVRAGIAKAWEILRHTNAGDQRKADRRVRRVSVEFDRRSGLDRRWSRRRWTAIEDIAAELESKFDTSLMNLGMGDELAVLPDRPPMSQQSIADEAVAEKKPVAKRVGKKTVKKGARKAARKTARRKSRKKVS